MYCSKCGAENREGGKFCKMCGEPLAGAVKGKKTGDETAAASGRGKKRNGKKYAIIGTILAIVLAAAGVVAIFLLPGVIKGGASGKEKVIKRTPDKDILLPVFENGRYGYKNIQDEWVIQPQFEDAQMFNDQDVAVVDMGGESYLIDREGKVIVSLARKDEPYAYCSRYSTKAGLIPTMWFDEERDIYGCGFINKQGIPIGRIYDDITWPNEGAMKEQDYYLVASGEKSGYVNGENEEVISLVYDDLGNIGKNGLIRAKVNEQWGWINEKNEIVIPFVYEETGAFHYGMAKVWQNGRAGFINEKGKQVIPCIYDNAGRFGKNGLAPVRQGEKWGYINQKGEMVIPAQYDMAYSSGGEMLSKIEINGRYGYIDKDNKAVIPAVYDSLGEIEENGWIQAWSGWQCGYIDQENQIVIPIEYDEMGSEWKDGIQVVEKDDLAGCINEKNEMIYQIEDPENYWYGMEGDDYIYNLELGYQMITTERAVISLKTGEKFPQDIKEIESLYVRLPIIYENLGLQFVEISVEDMYSEDEKEACIWLDLDGNILAKSSEPSFPDK